MTAATFTRGQAVKVRDKYTPTKSRREATVVEDLGDEGVVCLVHHKAARGGTWQSKREIVARARIIS